MCGRFALSLVAAELSDVFGVAAPEGYRPRWNITPDSPILIVRHGAEGRVAVLVRWGFLGPWMTDAADPGRQINARLETVATKPMFKAAFLRGRCIVPADGFYEWQKQPRGPSRPFFVRAAQGSTLLLAGLWRRNRLADGSLLETAAIVTRPADPALAAIHPRMPVIVPPELVDSWLAADTDPAALASELLAWPTTSPSLVFYAVSRLVNDPRRDGSDLIAPVDATGSGPALLL
jgi:putative SOS response-associated peptidase YedK